MASNATGNAEIQVSTTLAEQMFSPSITLLPAGGWIAVWNAENEDEGNEFERTMMQRFDADGNPAGNEVQVGDPGAGYRDPTVVPLADGGWLVLHDRGDIVQQRFDADGNAVGGETQINTVSGDLRQVSAAVLEEGSWVVAWQRGAGNEDVFQQKFDVNGNAVGGEVRVNTTTSGRQFMDDIAALADGGWVVTFESPDGNSDGVFQQRYNADGVKVGSQTRVNTTTSGSQEFSTVTGLADGGWVVTWHGPDGDQDGIFQQRYGSNGAKVGSETLINTTTASFQTDPVVAALSDGGWVIVWRSGAQDGSGTGIYMQRIAANGAAVGTETLVNVTTAGNQSDVSVTALDGGGWVVTWKSEDPVTFVDTVQQRVFADDIRGTDGNDDLGSTAFGEAILGLGGDDTINGLGGDDTIEGGAGADAMDGGAGVDTLSYANSTQGVTVRLSDGTASGGDADGDTFANFENVTGSEAGDTLVGSAGANVLRGGAGSDTLIGGNGADVLEGGDGADNMDGGAGIDTLSYADSNLGVTVRLSDGTAIGGVANGDTFANFENVTGSAHNDTLEGTTGVNVLVGGDGNDTLIGRGGADRLEGENGNDTFRFLPNEIADATIDGGAGSDRLLLETAGEGQHVYDLTGTALASIEEIEFLADGGDLVEHTKTVLLSASRIGGAGLSSTLVIDGNDSTNSKDLISISMDRATSLDLSGWAFQDWGTVANRGTGEVITITGDADVETITGSRERDVISGGGGGDTMVGGLGTDTFIWNPGDGSDTIEGGDGTDTLDFNGSDAKELIGLVANGSRLSFTRDVGNVTMDVNGVEKVSFAAGGGDDVIAVSNLAGTGVTAVEIDLAARGGGGDGAVDTSMVSGTNGADSIVVTSGGPGQVTVTGPAATTTLVNAEATDGLIVIGQGGDDVIDASALAAGRISLTIEAGLGADLISGSAGDDVIIGGDGNETAFMGDGDDTFTWNPGDDNDTINGQGGFDTLDFNGANAAEQITISANGGRTTLTRDVANVSMDLDGVEKIQFSAFGGADVITIGDLGGTGVEQVEIDLAEAADFADADTVIVNGSDGSDRLSLSTTAVSASVVVLNAQADDLVEVNAGAGDDIFDFVPGQGVTGLTFDGGADQNKLLLLTGKNGQNSYDLTGASFVAIEEIEFAADAGGFVGATRKVTISASQLGDGALSSALLIDGNDSRNSTDSVAVTMGSVTTLDLSRWTFDGWGTTARSGNSGDGEIITVTGDGQGETITGSSERDVIEGRGGNDTINGGGRNDVLNGGGGADRMIGGAGNETYIVDNRGDRVVERAGEGIDLVKSSIGFKLSNEVENLELTGRQGVTGIGNALANAITGNVGANTLLGGNGNDVLKGLSGNDLLDGGQGGDRMFGGGRNDTYVVDSRNDRVIEAGGQGNDLVKSSISFALGSHVEHLTLIGRGNLKGTGNGSANTITGNTGNNTLEGGGGNDTLSGGGGRDRLFGENGADKLLGGGGRDRLVGDNGGDKLLGGGGADQFVFLSAQDSTVKGGGRDFIDDFSRGQGDRINLQAIDANVKANGNQKFDFIGTDPFDNDAGELRFQKHGGNTLISADRNGDGKADFAILVDGQVAFKGGDFIL